MFDGFHERRIDTGDAEIFALTGGSGPPLVLLHGFPQTHVMWHRIAPQLAASFALVIPDLRGYGDSRGPTPDPEHRAYSKRVMAQDVVTIMAALGHTQFVVAGHDRGARVAYRLAFDRPESVRRVALLDILPTYEVWSRLNRKAALNSYHWLFLAQPAPLPERVIGRDPDFYLHHLLDRWVARRDALDPAAVAEYERAIRNPASIEAMCEDYRAGATVDFDDDRADREQGRRLTCPTLLVWGRQYLRPQGTTPLDVWREWAVDVREVALDCGHFLAEERPDECAAALREFFAAKFT